MKEKTDAVFEGGGVKGIGLVGAVSEIEKEYEFENLAGTSAGAIVSSLLAVGYSAAEIEKILKELDYKKFKDEGLLDKLGFIGKGLSIGFEYGIYEGDFFENWMAPAKARKKDLPIISKVLAHEGNSDIFEALCMGSLIIVSSNDSNLLFTLWKSLIIVWQLSLFKSKRLF